MSKLSRLMLALLVVSLAVLGCGKEKEEDEADSFSFVVYPNARYLPQLTDLTKQAHKVLKPQEPEAPPTAIYDTDASVEDVANFYAKAYGYNSVAPDATNNQGIGPILEKLHVKSDLAKAQGQYKAAEIAPKPNRPRVTIQRPYFDVANSQVVNKTIILMSR
jgi:hypothetical protein